jgi:hypothetical protein
MPNVNPGPASTATASVTNVLAPATFPNYNSQGQGSNAFRLLALQKAAPINATGDVVFPLINTQAFSLYPATQAVVLANPGAFVNGVFTPGTAAAMVFSMWSGPNATGTQIVAAATATTMTGATAALSVQYPTCTATGFYLASGWGVGNTNGQGGAASYNIYFHITTASASTATQCDIYVYGYDLT